MRSQLLSKRRRHWRSWYCSPASLPCLLLWETEKQFSFFFFPAFVDTYCLWCEYKKTKWHSGQGWIQRIYRAHACMMIHRRHQQQVTAGQSWLGAQGFIKFSSFSLLVLKRNLEQGQRGPRSGGEARSCSGWLAFKAASLCQHKHCGWTDRLEHHHASCSRTTAPTVSVLVVECLWAKGIFDHKHSKFGYFIWTRLQAYLSLTHLDWTWMAMDCYANGYKAIASIQIRCERYVKKTEYRHCNLNLLERPADNSER